LKDENNIFDDLIRKKIDDYEVPYDHSDWLRFEQLLPQAIATDKRADKFLSNRKLKWIFRVLFLIITSSLVYYFVVQKDATQVAENAVSAEETVEKSETILNLKDNTAEQLVAKAETDKKAKNLKTQPIKIVSKPSEPTQVTEALSTKTDEGGEKTVAAEKPTDSLMLSESVEYKAESPFENIKTDKPFTIVPIKDSSEASWKQPPVYKITELTVQPRFRIVNSKFLPYTRLFEYLETELDLSKYAAEDYTEQEVNIEFVVNQKGKIENITVVRVGNHEIDKLVTDKIKKLNNWKPGEINGIPVSSVIRLTHTFILTGDSPFPTH